MLQQWPNKKFLACNSGHEVLLFDADGELAAVIEALPVDQDRTDFVGSTPQGHF